MRKPKTPGLVSVAISTTITIIFWIFIALYQILTAGPDPVVDPNLLKQIDPTLDTSLLNTLDSKVYFEEGQSGPPLPGNIEITNQIQILPTETPTETEVEEAQTPISTEEAELQP